MLNSEKLQLFFITCQDGMARRGCNHSILGGTIFFIKRWERRGNREGNPKFIKKRERNPRINEWWGLGEKEDVFKDEMIKDGKWNLNKHEH